MSGTQCYEWFKRFKEGRMSVGEDPRPGRQSTSINDDHDERVRAVIHGNRRLTVRQVADEVGISIGSCHQIFTEKLQMRRVSAKFMPRLLTDDQSGTACHENGMKTFLKTSQQEMRRGFMDMMLKQRCNLRSGWGKGLLDQKKRG